MKYYSIFVKHTKLAFVIFAFFVVLLLFLYPQFKEVGETARLKIPKVDTKNPTLFSVEGARFFAEDPQGRPFSIEIKKALEKNSGEGKVFFEGVEGEIKLEGEDWAVFESKKGHFDQQTKILFLFESVSFMSNNGYYIDAEEMEISMDDFSAKSEQPLTVHGGFGQIEAKGFEYSKEGVLKFKGPIESTIDIKRMK